MSDTLKPTPAIVQTAPAEASLAELAAASGAGDTRRLPAPSGRVVEGAPRGPPGGGPGSADAGRV